LDVLTRLYRLFDKAGLDEAVRFALLARASQGIAGAVTLVLIAYFFSPVVQGFYYTLMSLLALQAFVELGLYIVIVNRASHEWSELTVEDSGAVSGDLAALSRLASLMRFIANWYAAMGVLFVLGVGIAGHVFLRMSQAADVAWQAPWWTSLALAALLLWLTAMVSLLEGCNQVVAVNRFRLVQTIAEGLAIWLLLATGAGLWVIAGSLAVKVLATLLFFWRRYRRFFLSVYGGTGRERIRWRQEIWPMQWRLAAQGVVNYLMFSLFTPVMFHYHGAKAAGQMGMTLQIVGMVMLIGQVWVQTKVPRFGVLVAKRNFAELDRVWWQASKISLVFVAAAGFFVWTGIWVLGTVYPELAARILSPLPTLLFLMGFGLMQVLYFQALYLRAHAREPYLVLGVSGGVLIGLLVFLFGSKYGPMGAAGSFLIAISFFLLPVGTLIWLRRRAEWQGGEPIFGGGRR